MSKAIAGAAMLAGAVADGVAMFAMASTGVGLAAMPLMMHIMESLAIGGISMEAGAIADALTQNRGIGITTRQPAAFRQIIYGEQRVGGIMVYESTTGSHNDQYNMIIVIATHEIDSIINLYLDGRQVYWTGSGPGYASGPGGVPFGGNANGNTYIGPGGQHYNFGGKVYCEARYGNQADGDVIGGMTANDPTWAATSQGAPYLGGCAYVYLKVEYDPSMFPNQPEVKFTVRGKNNIIDPRITASLSTPPLVLARPTTLTNGWAANAQQAAYEEGVNQGYNWGYNSSATLPYNDPNNAVDNDLTTAANCQFQHTHQYAGCIWTFVALPASPTGLFATPNASGGSLAAATYYYKVAAIVNGVETIASSEVSAVTTGSTSEVALSWSAVTGATSYKIYRGTAASGESIYYTSNTNSFTDTGAAGSTGAPVTNVWLNVNSMVNPYTFTGRSAGIWYSIDGGSSWTQIYNTPNHAQYWDSVELSPTQDFSQVQVMAFTDAHDDMAHFVYDIQLASAQQANGTASNGGVFTNNWALIVADVLQDNQWGLGDLGSVNVDQLIAAANVCDEQIELAQGGTEANWACNWHYDTGIGPGDVLQTMMNAAAGRLSRIGGEWFVWPAYWQGPSFSFDESVFVGGFKWKPYRKFRELFNRVNGTYIAPNYPYNVAGNLYDQNGWYDGTIQNNFPYAFQPTNYPQYAADPLHGYAFDAFLAQDGGIQLPKEVTQQCVLSVSQAQRAAKIILLRNRQQGSTTFLMKLVSFQMQPLDVMTMTFPANGWDHKQLEITSTTFTVHDGTSGHPPSVTVSCGVQETDQSVYEWSTAEELSVYDVPANPTVGPPSIVQPPTNLVAEADSQTALIGSDGSATPRILLTWTPPSDSTVTQINVQFQAVGAPSWTVAPALPASATATYITGVIAGQSYNIEIQAVRGNGATSVWVELTNILVTAPASGSTNFLTEDDGTIIYTQNGDLILVV